MAWWKNPDWWVVSFTLALTFPPAPRRTKTGPGETTVQLTVGAVASRLIVTDTEFLPPALLAWQMSEVPSVSLVIALHPRFQST